MVPPGDGRHPGHVPDDAPESAVSIVVSDLEATPTADEADAEPVAHALGLASAAPHLGHADVVAPEGEVMLAPQRQRPPHRRRQERDGGAGQGAVQGFGHGRGGPARGDGLQELIHDRVRLEARRQRLQHRHEFGLRVRRDRRAIETGDGRGLFIELALLSLAQWFDKPVIGGDEAIDRCGGDPVEEVGIQRCVSFAARRLARHAGMHVVDALDHPPRRRGRAIDPDQRGGSGAPRPAERIGLEGGVIPHARPDARLGELQ